MKTRISLLVIAKQNLWVIIIVSLFIVAGSGQNAQANLVTFDFQGSVTAVDPLLAGTFNTTQTVSGAYTFDSATPNSTPSLPHNGLYPALTALSFTINGYAGGLGGGPNQILIWNDAAGPIDRYTMFALSPSGANVGNMPPALFFLGLTDYTGTALSDILLPTTPPELSLFSQNEIVLLFLPSTITDPQQCLFGDCPSVTATLTSLTPVPEPATMILLGSGLIGLWGARKKFKK